ncbi:hypothetical protein [Streptomyces apocyni]|uniref:hypothetical protein n=1 Tax=Streptomyces apocyni TaxID=2654677 RepID=UPI001E3DB049
MEWRGLRRWSIPRALVVPLALGLGAVWWWAVLRLAVVPERSGVVEGAVAVGGWGLSLLPLHCVPKPATRAWRRRRSDAGSGPS